MIAAQLHSIPVEGSEEDVTFCKAAITDITQRKEMEETIRRSHAFLQTVIDAIQIPYWSSAATIASSWPIVLRAR